MSPVVAYVCKACTVLSVVRTTSSLSVWTVKKNLKNSIKLENLSQCFKLYCHTCTSSYRVYWTMKYPSRNTNHFGHISPTPLTECFRQSQ